MNWLAVELHLRRKEMVSCVEPLQEVPLCLSVESLNLEVTHQGVSLKESGPVKGNLHCSLFIVSQVLPRMPDHILLGHSK